MNVVQLAAPGGPDVLARAVRPLPEPGPGEARVRAAAIGVSSADILVRSGTYKWMPPLPAVPGNEMAGTVEALGPGAAGVALGDRVLVSSRELPFRGGCYAEAICVPAEGLFRLPDTISSYDAVTLPNYQLAGAMLYESGIRRPGSVLIHGAAGGVAMAVIQLCLADGILPVGTVSSPEKRAYALAAGVPHVILRGAENVLDAVMRITGGRGVDVVFDMAGPGFTANLDLLAPLGTLVSFNTLSGVPDADLFTALRRLLARSLGVRCYSIHTMDAEPSVRRGLMRRAIELMAAGRLRPPPPTVLPLDAARRAHELIEARASIGKIVLVP